MSSIFSKRMGVGLSCIALAGLGLASHVFAGKPDTPRGKPQVSNISSEAAAAFTKHSAASASGNPVTLDDNAERAQKLRAKMQRHLARVGKATRNQPLVTRKDGTLSQVVPVEFLKFSVARVNADGSVSVHHAGNLDEVESVLATDSSTTQRADR